MALGADLLPGPGHRVVVWGFGTHGGGLAAARLCRDRGAQVTILEAKPATAFGELAQGWPWAVGGGDHPLLAEADLVVASPAIPPRAWPARHGPRTCPEHLFFALHRGPRVVVSGTKGKSTTARILGCLLGWPVGGNSYEPLLTLLERHGPDQGVVCELSSFQAWYLNQHPPRIDGGVLTTLAVDHLDWHPDLEHYHGAKTTLLASAPCLAVDPALAHRVAQAVRLVDPCPWVDRLAARSDLALLGDHNVANAALAIALALELGTAPTAVAPRLRQVQPLEHRLQPVPGLAPWRYIDDSIATTPESAMAAMAALEGPLAILLGGSDKGADFTALAQAVRRRGAVPVLIGTTGPRLAAALGGGIPVHASLPEAVAAARAALPGGGTVLLSPACASFDWFRGFEDRGRRFQTLATEAMEA